MCAFIGDPGAGKSNVLSSLRALLDPAFDLSTADVTPGQRATSIEATLGDGRVVSIVDRDGAPPILYFPVALRGGELLAPTPEVGEAKAAQSLIRQALADAPAPRVALVRGLEACSAATSGVVFAIEEPELFLVPQAHRYLRRVIRRLGERGNQVFFTTHAPSLLSVAALEEVNLVRRDELGVTTVEQLRAVEVDEAFRVSCEFDAERAELFVARAVILVEGMSEKVVLPFVFHALGHDPDREQISIVECGGKSNMPLFVEICRRARVPYVVLHDSDLRPGSAQVDAHRKLNERIRVKAGADRTVVLQPDFEGVAGFRSRAHKPQRAWRRLAYANPDEIPEPFLRAVRLALDLASRRSGRASPCA